MTSRRSERHGCRIPGDLSEFDFDWLLLSSSTALGAEKKEPILVGGQRVLKVLVTENPTRTGRGSYEMVARGLKPCS